MADEIAIDKEVFQDRLSSFVSHWKADKRSGDALFGGAGSIIICVGKASDGGNYGKSAAFQLWLLGYEFPATLFVLTPEALHIVTTKKKASYLEPLKGGKVPVEIYVRTKDNEANMKLFEKCVEVIKAAGKKVGVLNKDVSAGPFAEEWKKAYGEIQKDMEEVEIATTISSAALSVKDEKELRAIRDASRASSGVMANYFVEEMSSVLDEEKKISHKTLADKVTAKIDDSKFFQKIRVSSNFDPINLDWSFSPTVQSGGKYDLRFASEPNDNNLHDGVIVAALGLRYQTYSSMIARTYMINPNKLQEANYKVLLAVHETVLKAIKDGVTAKEVYNKALNFIKSKKPELEKHFLKNVGYGIGIESRDGTLLLSGKSNRVLKDGMTLNVMIGFSDIQNEKPQDKKSNVYSLVLCDTVRVTTGDTVVFTKDAATDLEATSFFFEDEEEKPAPKPKEKSKTRGSAIAASNVKSTRLRADRGGQADVEKEAQRKEHQKEMHAKRQQAGLERYGEDAGAINGAQEKKFKKFDSYKRDSQFPSKVRELAIIVDSKAYSVILPIMGRPVPFHINTVKNASTTNEGVFTSLRINFLSPGQGVGRKDDAQPFEDPQAHFVRSLTFRSKDATRMQQITEDITNLKKEVVRREQEKKQMEDVVEQDKLVLSKDRRPPRLEMLFLRPALDGKRVPGGVEIHSNGIRYVHGTGSQHVDVLFSNIKHLFFQPSKHELIVIIHMHLINPIMIGKKKTKDVQFYREATEMQFDETGNRKRRHRYGDEEEFEAEEEERRRRAELDKDFLAFTRKIDDAAKYTDLRPDIPMRELGFNGVHSRSSVLIAPSSNALVQLTEPPFLVITIDDVETVHLERVQFGLKNFDMVIVFKDFNRPPAHINTIPVESLEDLKDWLDSVEIPFSEGPLNLNWATIMKTVTQDPHQFFADGGWSFLSTESDDEEQEESEEESAFEMSESDLAASEESSVEDSEFDENASEDASNEDVSEDELSEAPSWDEQEKKAAKSDRKKGLDDEEETKKKPVKRKR